MVGHTWRPIDDLGEVDGFTQLALVRLDNAVRMWNSAKLEFSSGALKQFLEKLRRSIAVETGIIEGLYEIDRGLTQTLITRGFSNEALERTGESIEHSTLSLLKDQLASLDLIMDFIGGTRQLTPGYIREIHSLITRSQNTSDAVDPSGRVVSIPLISGEYKSRPNNPTLQDGSVHEYAPVEQVASEMDRLADFFSNIAVDEYHPVIAAAWLHHRFTQIHPFQDGNGRVARVLASMVLQKAGLFPLRIRREDRDEYIDALEAADSGSLDALVQLVAKREREDVLWAVSEMARVAVAHVAGRRTVDVAGAVAGEYRRRQLDILEERRQVNSVAQQMVELGADVLQNSLHASHEEFSNVDLKLWFEVEFGGSHDGRGHFWHYQIVESAKHLDHWANLSENKYWLRSILVLENQRIRFVVSLHHTGSPISGIMAATAFAEIQHDESYPGENPGSELVHCSERAFTFTADDAGEDLDRSFEDWLDKSQAVALHILGNTLI